MSDAGIRWKMRYANKIETMFDKNNDSDEYVDLNDSYGMSDEQFNKWFESYKNRIQKKEEDRVKNMSEDEKQIDELFYTRQDQQYNAIGLGPNVIDAEYEFYRRILVNLADLYKSKGTRSSLEFFLKFFALP